MHEVPPETVTPFVFSDPAGKRWPRLRLILLIAGVLCFLGTVLFVQTLFVTPQMSVPFSLRQLKGQLKAQHRRLRCAREKNRRVMKCGSRFIPMVIPIATHRSSSTRRRSRTFAPNG